MIYKIIASALTIGLTLYACYTSYRIGRIRREEDMLDDHTDFLIETMSLQKEASEDFRRGYMLCALAWGGSINGEIRENISKLLGDKIKDIEEELKEAENEHTAA